MADNNTIKVSMTVSGGNLTSRHSLNVELSFNVDDQAQIMQWAADNRIIALQRVLRATSDEYVRGLGGKLSISAAACGGKIETNEEKIQKLVIAGMPPAMAKMAVENPTKFAALMAELGKK